ncbi:cytochrome P450 [Bombardia bombarda]|uniref:Cytochrome P450 n=1 Tax=Bombardia bombarda TaxID=252184 RepID=A0AA40CGN0_9PEZI|nr:cytochrome P450 [Bombardia bombarda]
MFGVIIAHFIASEYPDIAAKGLFYLDNWPFADPMIWVFEPDMAAQFIQDHSLPKSRLYETEFGPFTQCRDLVSLEGAEWKRWRAIFNPGFSAKNLVSLVPTFLQEIRVFTNWLKKTAESGEIIKLEDQAMKLTIDIIGRAALGARLHCQTTDSVFKDAMEKQITWLVPDGTPSSILKLINPFRRPIMWYHNRTMKNYFMPFIDQGIAEYSQNGPSAAEPKTINSLAIKAYLTEKLAIQDSDSLPTSASDIDQSFIDMTISQLKIFMFAGHDTTGTTLSFALYLLNKPENASTLAALRAEHDAVLGPDPAAAEAQIAANPNILNALPYTLAVVKETLRLNPPAGTVRKGQPGFFLTHPDTKTQYPTDGFVLFGCSHLLQRLDEYYPRPHEFVPERWLAAEGDPLYVRKNTFRSFELGPRNCIGQELALLELKAILALTVREMDVEACYADDAPEVLGEKAYQVMLPWQVTGHPKGGMPVRIKMRG